MLSTLSTALKEILDSRYQFSPEKEEEIIEFISHYQPHKWIYPGVLKRELNIRIEDVYSILSALEKAQYLESWYEYCCGHCQHVLGTVQRFNELPDRFECEFCGNEMSTLDNTIKIYRVCAYE